MPKRLRYSLRSTGLLVVVTCVILAILGGTIYWQTLQLRAKIRAQTIRKDGESLHAVALMRQITGEAEDDLGGQIEEFADQFDIALQISQLNSSVIATRLLERDGTFAAAFPAYIAEGSLPPQDLKMLQQLTPVSHYFPEARLNDLFHSDLRPPEESDKTVPLLEVSIPLHRRESGELLGIAQFILDGAAIRDDFAALDRNLFIQSGTMFLIGATVIIGVFAALGWTFRSLEQSNRLLTERTDHLLQANQQLALAAKTSAVGAVTAYLVHGLNNPLAGLRDFMASREVKGSEEWDTAMATTQRMHQLINDVVRVLGEESELERYELTLEELLDLLTKRTQTEARAAGVQLQVNRAGDSILPNRDANLLLLILDNLLQNAIQATPRGKSVRLDVQSTPQGLAFQVADQGPGFPAHLLPTLFAPCRSTREGGSGIGLSIAKQLANHLGAELTLNKNTPEGCVFTLQLASLTRKTPLASKDVVR